MKKLLNSHCKKSNQPFSAASFGMSMGYRMDMSLPIPSISPTTQERIQRAFIQGFSSEAVQRAATDRPFAGPNLSKWFRAQRKLGSRDRRIVSEVVYTLIRFERWFVAAELLSESLHPGSDLTNVFAWMHDPTPLQQFDLATHLSIPDWMSTSLSDIPDIETFAQHHQQRAPLHRQTYHCGQ